MEMGPFLFGDRKNSNLLKLKVQKELHTTPEKCEMASGRPGDLAKGAGTEQLSGTDLVCREWAAYRGNSAVGGMVGGAI